MAYVATLPIDWATAGAYRHYGRGSRPARHFERYAIARGRFGLGAAATASQLVGAGGSIAAPVITAAAAPGVAAMLGISASLAVPLVGAAFAGVLLGVELLLHSGCGQTCVQTSEWANEAEPLLVQNIQRYFSLSPRTKDDQASALNMFDAIWAGLIQRCGQPGFGTAGKNCIADRQAGACKWKADKPARWPGGVEPGQCFNWFADYRDPIANDTGVVGVGSGLISALSPGAGKSIVLPVLVIGGLVALGLML